MSSFAFGGFTIHPVGLSIGLGVLASFYLFRSRASREGLGPQAGAALHLAATLGALIGSRLPAASEGRLFEPPADWILSPSFALLGALLATDYLRMRMKLDRGAVLDLMATAAAPLLVFLGVALAMMGLSVELVPCLLPLGALVFLAKPDRRPGVMGATMLAHLALGAILRHAFGGPSAEVFGVAEPIALAAVALLAAVVAGASVVRR
jgi:hypothetical protein